MFVFVDFRKKVQISEQKKYRSERPIETHEHRHQEEYSTYHLVRYKMFNLSLSLTECFGFDTNTKSSLRVYHRHTLSK
jgi:hypothetical protein